VVARGITAGGFAAEGIVAGGVAGRRLCIYLKMCHTIICSENFSNTVVYLLGLYVLGHITLELINLLFSIMQSVVIVSMFF
jgi:hypothetical protein